MDNSAARRAGRGRPLKKCQNAPGWYLGRLDPSLGRTSESDYAAFVMLACTLDGLLFVDADLERRNAFQIVERGVQLLREFQPDVFAVEATQFQEILADLFWEAASRQGLMPNVKGITSNQDKNVRIRMRLTAPLARRMFRFRRGSGGTALLVSQLKAFPNGTYDDGPDALEMAVRMCEHLVDFGLGQDGMIDERAVP